MTNRQVSQGTSPDKHTGPERVPSPFIEMPSGIAIAHYFCEETEWRNPSCDGIALWRDGLNYCYLWVEATVDHDMWMSYLLDIRTQVGPDDGGFHESRDFLFLHFGAEGVFDVEWQNSPIAFDAPVDAHIDRLHEGLKWFTDRVIGAVEHEPRRRIRAARG